MEWNINFLQNILLDIHLFQQVFHFLKNLNFFSVISIIYFPSFMSKTLCFQIFQL